MFQTANDVRAWLIEHTEGIYSAASFIGGRGVSASFMKKRAPIIKEFAHLMRSHPDLIRALFRMNWPEALIANMAITVERAAEFDADQALNIIQDSWVGPQVAAGFALTTDGRSIPLLEAFLGQAAEEKYQQYPKPILSAYAALKLLGNKRAIEFEQTSIFTDLQAVDSDKCVERAFIFYHMEIWQDEYAHP